MDGNGGMGLSSIIVMDRSLIPYWAPVSEPPTLHRRKGACWKCSFPHCSSRRPAAESGMFSAKRGWLGDPAFNGDLLICITLKKQQCIMYNNNTNPYFSDNRRKFRSQTSDNMERWKSRGGKSQGGEVKKWEDQRRERVRSKKMQVREMVGKLRFTVFCPMICLSGGSKKVTSLKRRVRSQLSRWEIKNCTPLWHEAHVQVKMYKTHQVRTTFGSSDVEKVHGVVARSTFPSQNVQNTPTSEYLGPLLEVEMSKKCTP